MMFRRPNKTFFDVPFGSEGRVVIFGIPWDQNTSCRKGSANLPMFSRLASEYLEEYSIFQSLDIREESVVDIGDIVATDFNELDNKVSSALSELENKRLVVVGGDHSITLTVVKQQAKYIRRYIHIDAHADMYPEYDGNKFSHASVLSRIVEIIDPTRILLLGVRTFSRIEEDRLEEYGIDYYTSREIEEDPSILENELANADYISIDLDVFDPSFIPDVACPEPFGLDPKLFLGIFRSSRLKARVVDIVEGVPESAFSLSAIITATFVREFSLILAHI